MYWRGNTCAHCQPQDESQTAAHSALVAAPGNLSEQSHRRTTLLSVSICRMSSMCLGRFQPGQSAWRALWPAAFQHPALGQRQLAGNAYASPCKRHGRISRQSRNSVAHSLTCIESIRRKSQRGMDVRKEVTCVQCHPSLL